MIETLQIKPEGIEPNHNSMGKTKSDQIETQYDQIESYQIRSNKLKSHKH